MKINLHGATSLVTSVSVSLTPVGLSTLIDCNDRYVDCRRLGSTPSAWSGSKSNMRLPVHDSFIVYGPDDEQCEVVVIAESEEDCDNLRGGTVYTCEEDGQIEFLRIRNSLMHDRRRLATIQTSSPNPGETTVQERLAEASAKAKDTAVAIQNGHFLSLG